MAIKITVEATATMPKVEFQLAALDRAPDVIRDANGDLLVKLGDHHYLGTDNWFRYGRATVAEHDWTQTPIERYRGIDVLHEPAYGYHTDSPALGFCDTIDELRAEIDELRERQEQPLDTPSLDTSFHDHEMDID